MATAGVSAPLSDDDWEAIERVLDRFERAWKDGPSPFIADYLPPDLRLRPYALQELVKVDLEARWRKGELVPIEKYLADFPDLRNDSNGLASLLAEEYAVRHRYGNRPDLDEYLSRFPAEYSQVEKLAHEGSTGPRKPLPSAPQQPVAETLLEKPGGPAPLPKLRNDGIPEIGRGYRITKWIGGGTFGQVWRAEAPGGVEVAVKIVARTADNAAAKQEQAALELIKKLNHPFLTRTQAFWPLGDQLVIVMELADSSLRVRLKQSRKSGENGLPLSELLGYLREACEALDFLHAQKVAHRDIKPDNILLSSGHVKLADFGLAKVLPTQFSVKGTLAGTPHYMAPEIWRERAGSGASDLFSLAVTYVELRCGRRPFAGRDWVDLMLAVTDTPPNLDDLTAAERPVLLRALDKNPRQRYRTCGEFYEALALSVKSPKKAAPAKPPAVSEPIPQVSEPKPIAPRRVGRRTRFSPTAGLLCGILLFGFQTPSVPQVALPASYRPADGARLADVGPFRVYDRIVRDLPDGSPVEFLLILPSRSNDPGPFYMQRDKLTNRVFAAFAPQRSDNAPDFPAFNVTLDDAQNCARWLGGDLPTVRQWDQAAGRWDGIPGPFTSLKPWKPGESWEPGEFALEPAGAMAVGTATRDVCPTTGCRGMASNGFEWTRTAADGRDCGPSEPLSNYSEFQIRGMDYHAVNPLDFKQLSLAGARTKPLRTESGTSVAELALGFRVVIELK